MTSIVFASNQDKINANKTQMQKMKENIKVLENERLGIDAELAELLNKLIDKQSQIDEVQEKIDTLQSDIDSLQVNIDETLNKIAVTEANISNIEKDYNDKELAQEYQEQILSKRLKRNYMNNTYNEFLGILLDSDSISDVLFKIKYISNIMSSDREIITNLKEIKEDLNKSKKLLEIEKKSLTNSKQELTSEQQEIKDKKSIFLEEKTVLDTQLNDLKSLESAKQEKINSIQANKNSLESQISDLAIENENLTRDMQEASMGHYSKGSSTATGQFMMPTKGRYTSPFGSRTHPITKKHSNHTGQDIANSSGTTIVAADSGKVVRAKYYGAYGNCVVIDHGNGYSTMYAHMRAFSVSLGDTVAKGQKVGEMGTTGWSTGPHLHFEIWKNGVPQNPRTYLG